MRSKTYSVASETKEHDRDFHVAFLAVKQARQQHINVRPHRSITPLKVTPYLLAQAMLLPLLFCALLLWGKPILLDFWRDCVLFWSSGFGLPFSRAIERDEAGNYASVLSNGFVNAPYPSSLILLVTGLITLVALAFSTTLKGAALPLKYPIRIVSVVQLIAVVYFWLTPASFPYSVARHSEELMTIGFVVMLASPVMLSVGYYILNQSLWLKILHTVLILAFFAIMIPHQVVAQALIMQHLSVLFMPLLYLCLGAVFDALVFVALYSWAVSNAPAKATT